MTSASKEYLERIYVETDDPWNHATSAYERGKYNATLNALTRRRYKSVLELGCGNGELAKRLCLRAGRYEGVDSSQRALSLARKKVPEGKFFNTHLPALPARRDYDLIVLSEVLYFLDHGDISTLASSLTSRAPKSEVVTVNWLGETGHELSGSQAADIFVASIAPSHFLYERAREPLYQIDVFSPL